MITAEISRFVDEDVHRSAYVVCLGVNVDGYNDLAFWQQFGINYRTFGSDRRKLVDNANAATRQWRHPSMTSIFIDAQLRSSAENINAQL